jgi:ribosome maturation factor RimP
VGAREEEFGRVEALAREAAGMCGVEVVEVRFHGSRSHSVLRIDIDREGPTSVSLADCEAMSRRFDRLLEERGLLQEVRYDLQVSSPGLDRPIRSDADFRRNAGRPVIVEIVLEDQRSETHRGVLLGATAAEIVLRGPGGDDLRLERDRARSVAQDPSPNPSPRPPRAGRKSRDPRGIV